MTTFLLEIVELSKKRASYEVGHALLSLQRPRCPHLLCYALLSMLSTCSSPLRTSSPLNTIRISVTRWLSRSSFDPRSPFLSIPWMDILGLPRLCIIMHQVFNNCISSSSRRPTFPAEVSPLLPWLLSTFAALLTSSLLACTLSDSNDHDPHLRRRDHPCHPRSSLPNTSIHHLALALAPLRRDPSCRFEVEFERADTEEELVHF